jgi:hypothetical protein
MKIRSIYIIIALVLALIAIFATSCGCYNVVPYSNNSPFKHEYVFEGLENEDKEEKEEFTEEEEPEEKKVEGFEGLMPAPFAESKLLDPFFKAESKPDCQGSGLTKGAGGLCLTPELKILLQTRGKNATGGESQIGN